MTSKSYFFAGTVALAMIVAGTATFVGCNSDESSSAPAGFSQLGEHRGGQSELFQTIARNLNELERYENAQVLPHTRDLLNQWAQREQPAATWKPDPLTKSLPDELQKIAVTTSLDRQGYSLADAQFLETCMWLRDIARRLARASGGSQFDELTVAQALFDWTVRNIQLDPDGETKASRFPGEILLAGKGSAAERAWIFILLARQQQLDAVMLALADEAGALQTWAPAVLVKGELYLFDPRLGLPIPAGDSSRMFQKSSGAEASEPQVATLRQVLSDPARLRSLDLNAEHPYPHKAEDLKNLIVLVEASPQFLTRRMKLIEGKLTGNERAVLTVDASALAAQAQKAAGVRDVRLWSLPYEVWRDREDPESPASQNVAQQLAILEPSSNVTLWKARVLQFKGKFDGEEGAKQHYMAWRAPTRKLELARKHPEVLMAKDERLPGEPLEAGTKPVTFAELDARRARLETMKTDATYWLGLVAFEEENYPSARDYFGRRTLEAAPDGPWTGGATYNLARTAEATGDVAKAIELYSGDTSPQSHGNQLRARWLEAAGKKQPAAKSAEREAAAGK